jgi:hypothetical protein
VALAAARQVAADAGENETFGAGPVRRRAAVAALLDAERLGFVLLVLPVVLLFFCVHGLMGRWVAQRAGALGTGSASGLPWPGPWG